MIADDTNAIRDAMRKLAQAKVQAEAEAARKAASDDSAVNLPHPKPLFSESCPPFQGFCLKGATKRFEGGIVTMSSGDPPPDIDTDLLDGLAAKIKSLGGRMIQGIPHGIITDNPDGNAFDPNRYADAVNEWNSIAPDSEATGEEPVKLPLFFWGNLVD